MMDPKLLSTEYPGEDQDRVLEFFKGKNDGVFVDIGALDGFHLSNTRALWQKGWTGVMVEADSRAFTSLCQNYDGCGRVSLINAAVSTMDGNSVFYEYKGAPTFSSMDSRWVNRNGLDKFNSKPVWASRIGSLPLPEFFDFLNIDIEGLDSAIIEDMPETMRPTLIVAERNKDDRGDRIKAALVPRGYRKVWTSELNVAYAL